MIPLKHTISASEFKAKCLQIMDEVFNNHVDVIITKRGKPIAKLTALPSEEAPDIFGCMAGTVTIHGDIISPIEEEWEANE